MADYPSTLDEWNQQLSCCCQMPECPEILKVCESVDGFAESTGFWIAGDDQWHVIQEKIREDSSFERSEVTIETEVGGGQPFTEGEGVFESSVERAQEWDALVDVYVGPGSDCYSFTATVTESCEHTYTYSDTRYYATFPIWPGPPVPEVDWVATRTVENLGGQPTPQFIEWRLLYPTDEDYDNAVAAWDLYWEWVAYDEGDGTTPPEPDEPRPFPFEEPPEPQDRPEKEEYDDCEYRMTYFLDGVEDGTFVFDSTAWRSYTGGNTSAYEGIAPWVTIYDTWGPKTYFDDWVALARAALLPKLDLTNDDCLLTDPEDAHCIGKYYVKPEQDLTYTPPELQPDREDTFISMITCQFKWVVDSAIVWKEPDDPDDPPLDPPVIESFYKGDYYHVTWDLVTFPADWEAWKVLWDQYLIDKAIYDKWVEDGSIIPDPPELPPENPTPPGPEPTRPTYVQGTDEWFGPGDPEDDETWEFTGGWHEIPVPAIEGESRVCNVRFYCYPDSPYGVLPQVTGEVYDPDDPTLP